jgi:hypothetical protein
MKKLHNDQRGIAGVIGGLVNLVFGFIMGLLVLRFVLRLFAANPDHPLVAWIYSTSGPLVAPFFGIFNTPTGLTAGRLEFETLIALVVYGLIAAVVSGAFSFGSRRTL